MAVTADESSQVIAEGADADISAADPPGPRNRVNAAVDWLTHRDVLGVNAAVLLILLGPLAFGYYAKLHWPGYLLPPDSRYYVTMTLRDLGWSDSGALSKQWHLSGNIAESWYFAHSEQTWLVVQSRMVYPLLAAPFVAVFGLLDGMAMAAMLALAVAVWAVARLAQRLYGPAAALAAGGILAACGFMMDFAEAITDPVAIGVIALIMLNLPLGRKARAHNLVLLAMLSVLLDLTRQVMPTAAGMVFVAWLWATLFPGGGRPRRLRNDWTAPSAIVAGVTVSVHFLLGALAHRGAGSQVSQVTSNPGQIAWNLTHDDAIAVVQNDRMLTVLLVGALLFVLLRFTDIVSGLFLGALAGTYVIMIAGVTSSGLRYESIVYPAAALALGGLFHRLAPSGLAAGVVGDGTLRATGLPSETTWWQRGKYRVPGLGAACVVTLAFIVGWSATHGSKSMVGAVPTSPSAAAALAGTGEAKGPEGNDSAEKTLSGTFTEAEKLLNGTDSSLLEYVDWRHPTRWRPQDPTQPGWDHRDPDGTAVIYGGDLTDPQWAGLAGGLTFGGTVDPSSIKVLSRVKSPYGQDVVFTVADSANAKKRHRGHATVLYPLRKELPGIVTELVFDS